VLVTTYAKKNLSYLPEEIKAEFFLKVKNFHHSVEKDPEKFLFSAGSTKKDENINKLSDMNPSEDAAIYSLKLGSYNALVTIHNNMTIIHAVGEFSTD
jgi:hypothetical protein